MNCGLVDACVLGRLLADVIGGRRPIGALDDYERLRRPAAAEVLALANRLTMLATMRGPVRRSLRNLLLSRRNAGWPSTCRDWREGSWPSCRRRKPLDGRAGP